MISCIIFGSVNAQQLTIQVTAINGESLPGANIVLLHLNDSTKVYGATDLEGIAVFKQLKYARYQYTVSYLGFEDKVDFIEFNNQTPHLIIRLVESANVIDELKVVARRPLMRQDGERTIVDPTPLLGTVTNTLELLTMTPGLFVDDEGSVFLGTSIPAIIYINGREQRLSASDIANILRSLPPDNILRIEVIRNPSTKYDAASSGGVVNVVLKKGVKIGRFGSVNVGFNQGNLGNVFGGFNIYDTGDKTGYYINVNGSRDALLDELTAQRRSNAAFLLRQAGGSERYNDLGYIGFGMNTEFSDKWSFNYDGRVNGGVSRVFTDFNNKVLDFSGSELSDQENMVSDRTPFISHNHDIGMALKMDTMGSNLNLKMSFGQSFSENRQEYENIFNFPVFPSIGGVGDTDQHRTFFMAQADLNKEFSKTLRLESGLKYSLQEFKSDADFGTRDMGLIIPDAIRSNSYVYNEGVLAAYGQVTKNFENKISLTTGLRIENTSMDGVQVIPTDTSFNISRLDLFPYLFLSRPIVAIAGYELKGYLIYRRTLSRPSYQNLNPAVRIIDLYNYQTGNPGLAPQFTNNLEFNIGFDDVQIFALGKSYTSGIISNVLYNDPNDATLTANTFDNIGRSEETYFKVMGAIPPIFRYFFVVGAQYNHLNYVGTYEDVPISFTRGSWQLFTFQRFKITGNTTISMNAFMLVKGQRNFLELGNLGQLSFTLNQQLLDKKMNISIFVRDVLRTMDAQFLLNQGNILFEGNQYRDNQRWGMTLRYNFGIKTKREKQSVFGDGLQE